MISHRISGHKETWKKRGRKPITLLFPGIRKGGPGGGGEKKWERGEKRNSCFPSHLHRDTAISSQTLPCGGERQTQGGVCVCVCVWTVTVGVSCRWNMEGREGLIKPGLEWSSAAGVTCSAFPLSESFTPSDSWSFFRSSSRSLFLTLGTRRACVSSKMKEPKGKCASVCSQMFSSDLAAALRRSRTSIRARAFRRNGTSHKWQSRFYIHSERKIRPTLAHEAITMSTWTQIASTRGSLYFNES